MLMNDEMIIQKYGQSETGKHLQSLLKNVENTSSYISDILLITKTDEKMEKLIKILENGVTDRDEILYRAICIADDSEYDPTFLEGLDTEISVK